MSLWLRRDLRKHLYIAAVIKFLATYVYNFFYIFLICFFLDFIALTINLIQLLAAILIRINYLSIRVAEMIIIIIDLYSAVSTNCSKRCTIIR